MKIGGTYIVPTSRHFPLILQTPINICNLSDVMHEKWYQYDYHKKSYIPKTMTRREQKLLIMGSQKYL